MGRAARQRGPCLPPSLEALRTSTSQSIRAPCSDPAVAPSSALRFASSGPPARVPATLEPACPQYHTAASFPSVITQAAPLGGPGRLRHLVPLSCFRAQRSLLTVLKDPASLPRAPPPPTAPAQSSITGFTCSNDERSSSSWPAYRLLEGGYRTGLTGMRLTTSRFRLLNTRSFNTL